MDGFSWRPASGADRELLAATEDYMGKLGDDLLARTQRLVPKRTWSLHDSLAKEVETNGKVVTVSVGVDTTFVGKNGEHPADYAGPVERGTSRQAPQPYLLPALLQTKGVS